MALPRVKKCCCCSVKVGTLVLLYLGLFGGINNLFTKPFPELPDKHKVDNENEVDKAFVEAYKYFMESYEPNRVASCVIEILVSILGLYGVYKEKHLFLIPVLVCYASMLIGTALASIFVFSVFLWYGIYVGAVVFIVVINIVLAGLALLTQVIYSHYYEIKEKKEQPSKCSYVV